MSSPQTGSQPLRHDMEFVIISSLNLVLQSFLKLGDWIRTSWRLPRRNSNPWRKQVSSEGQSLRGPALSTRSRRRTVRGDPVVIIVVSTTLLFQIDINFPTLPISLLESQVQRFFPSSTFRKDIIRFQWLRMTSRRLQSLLRLRYLSSCDFLLGLETLDRPFIGLWIRFLEGLPYCFVYVDDILVFSPDLTLHMVHLREVLELCCLHGLTIGLPKCGFEVSEVEFLGHNLTSTGCRPLIKHTSAIKKFPIPTDKPALQRFLVLENFYRKFIKDAALILASLTNALKGPDKLLVWSSTMESAFLHAKHLLSTVHPAPGSAVSVIKDASKSLLGAVLQQQM